MQFLENPHFDFLGRAKFALILSVLLVAGGIYFVATGDGARELVFEVAVEGRELSLRPATPVTFTRLHSTRAIDEAREAGVASRKKAAARKAAKPGPMSKAEAAAKAKPKKKAAPKAKKEEKPKKEAKKEPAEKKDEKPKADEKETKPKKKAPAKKASVKKAAPKKVAAKKKAEQPLFQGSPAIC